MYVEPSCLRTCRQPAMHRAPAARRPPRAPGPNSDMRRRASATAAGGDDVHITDDIICADHSIVSRSTLRAGTYKYAAGRWKVHFTCTCHSVCWCGARRGGRAVHCRTLRTRPPPRRCGASGAGCPPSCSLLADSERRVEALTQCPTPEVARRGAAAP